MAKLWVNLDGWENRPLILRVGVNRVGRGADSDFLIDHASISSRHCEFILSADGVLIRDCGSTNGTFVDGVPAKETLLRAGQTVHLGEVKLMVESAEITISIPKQQQRVAARAGVGSPIVMPPGALVCPHHLQSLADYQCTQCHQTLCNKCVRSLKRQRGAEFFFCAHCNGKCQRITVAPKKKTFLQTVRDTVKLPFTAISDSLTPRK